MALCLGKPPFVSFRVPICSIFRILLFRGLSGTSGGDDQSEEGEVVEAEVVQEQGPLVRSGDSLQPIKVPDVFPEVSCLLLYDRM